MSSSHCLIPQKLLLRSALLVSAFCASPALLADEITGTLDGEPKEWHVVTHSEGSTAYFSELAPGIMDVTIQGHREPRFETQGTLSISFVVMNDVADDATVSYFPERGITPHYATEAEVPIEIELLNIDGATGRAKGRVTTSLAYLASMTEDYDNSNTMEIDVSFDVELQREDF